MTEPNSLDKDAVVVEGKSETEEETLNGEEEEAEEEQENIVADYGVILLQNLEGKGVDIQVLEHGVSRKATIDDIICVIGLAHTHMLSIITAAKVAKAMEGGMKRKIIPVSQGIRGPRR